MSAFKWKFHRLNAASAYDLGFYRVRRGYDLEFPCINVKVVPQEDRSWEVRGRTYPFPYWVTGVTPAEERFQKAGCSSAGEAKEAAEAWIIMLKLQGKI